MINRNAMNKRTAIRKGRTGILLPYKCEAFIGLSKCFLRSIKGISAILVLAVILSACGVQGEDAGAAQSTPPPASESVSDDVQVVEEETEDLPVFNKTSLAEYDGKEGRATYVAIDGKVYDISHVPQWKMGLHNGFSAGQDLTSSIGLSPHGKAILERMKAVVVGVYEE